MVLIEDLLLIKKSLLPLSTGVQRVYKVIISLDFLCL